MEEGLCEFFAFMYLQHKWEQKPTRKLYLQGNYIKTNRDPIYGAGFKKVNTMWMKFKVENEDATVGDFLNHLHIKYHKDRVF